jgi:hypothetical protein
MTFNSNSVRRGGSRGGGAQPAPLPPLKIGKNMIFFHTKYPKNIRVSLRSAQFFLHAPPLTWNPGSALGYGLIIISAIKRSIPSCDKKKSRKSIYEVKQRPTRTNTENVTRAKRTLNNRCWTRLPRRGSSSRPICGAHTVCSSGQRIRSSKCRIWGKKN